METFITLTIHGIAVGALLFLVAAGLSLIFGLMGVLNFAHGAFFLWGAYVWYAVFTVTNNFWLGLLAAAVAGAVLGALTERLFIRTLYQRPLSQILVTLGLGLVLTQLVSAIWGETPLYPSLSSVPALSGLARLGAVYIPYIQLFAIGVGIVMLVAVWSLLRFTRVGLIVRAGVENSTMVQALGINVGLVFLAVFALGSALAALGGAVYAPVTYTLTPEMGQGVLLSAIIVVVLGGLGSYLGSALGALLIGLAQEYVPTYAPAGIQNSAAALISLALLVAILLIRPQGLLGTKIEAGGL